MAYAPRPMSEVLAGVARGTGAGARRTSNADLEAARVQAAGRPAPAHNPELQAYGEKVLLDRVSRTVMGRYGDKGRYPMHTLSHGQFAQFQSTGQWEGMPTPEEYGPQSETTEDKEYTPIGES